MKYVQTPPFQICLQRLRLWPYFAREWFANRKYAGEIAQGRQFLQQVCLQPRGKSIFIFAPGLSWDKQLFQRPQQLAWALAQQDALVFYWEPPHPPPCTGIHKLTKNLFWVDLPSAVLTAIPHPLIYQLPWTYPLGVQPAGAQLIYDIVDDFSTFRINQKLLMQLHQQRMQTARLVLASAKDLVERFSQEREDILYCPNGVRMADFERQLPVPADMAELMAQEKPIAGYVGAIAEWFDYDLLKETAAALPEVNFVLIGPSEGAHLAESGLLEYANLHWLGVKPYEQIPAYIQTFSAGLIPFKLMPLTHAVSPLKLFEYYAAGKPAVITAMRESSQIAHVFSAEGAAAFQSKLLQAFEAGKAPGFQEALRDTARVNTWAARARLIIENLAMV